MDFNQLIMERIAPQFKGYGFSVAEQYKDYFRFESNAVEIRISYNEFDRTSHFEIGKAGGFSYPLNDKVIKQVFGSDACIDKEPKEIFVDNILLFLESNGSILLRGDESKFLELNIFSEEESEEYTFHILQEQNLAAANKAWDNGDFKDFVKIIDQTNKKRLPSLYKLRYKIANQKIKS